MPQLIKLDSNAIYEAVDKVVKGELSKKEEFAQLLEDNGASAENIAQVLSSMLYTEKGITKLRVIERLLSQKGLLPKEDTQQVATPTIVFQIQSESPVQINNLFTPQRES